MAKFKDREAKEAPYIEHNKDVLSVCSGSFYIKGRNIHERCKNREKCQKYAKYKDKKDETPQVGFYYVDSFRKCDLWKYKTIDGSFALRIAIYNILYVNDLACACVIDMKDKVKSQDKETQKIFRALTKRQVKYEEEITEIIGEKIGFLADYNLEMDDSVHGKIADLYDAIYTYLKECNVENCKFIALAELALTMIGYSIHSIDKRISECLKYNKDVVYLRRYKLTEMYTICSNLCKWLDRKCENIDLNRQPSIVSAFGALDKTLTSCSVIQNAIAKAQEKECCTSNI